MAYNFLWSLDSIIWKKQNNSQSCKKHSSILHHLCSEHFRTWAKLCYINVIAYSTMHSYSTIPHAFIQYGFLMHSYSTIPHAFIQYGFLVHSYSMIPHAFIQYDSSCIHTVYVHSYDAFIQYDSSCIHTVWFLMHSYSTIPHAFIQYGFLVHSCMHSYSTIPHAFIQYDSSCIHTVRIHTMCIHTVRIAFMQILGATRGRSLDRIQSFHVMLIQVSSDDYEFEPSCAEPYLPTLCHSGSRCSRTLISE